MAPERFSLWTCTTKRRALQLLCGASEKKGQYTFIGKVCEHLILFNILGHGPLKLRTVHLSDNTIIYESKVSVQNVFP